MSSILTTTSVTALLSVTLGLTVAHAGAYLGSSLVPDGVMFPEGYSGTESVVTVDVCLVPGSEQAGEMEQGLKNAVALWNRQQATSANLRINALAPNKYDFESAALHELGHCVGLGHPNLGFGAGRGNEGFTQSTTGADGLFNLQAGADGIAGSADDVRADDRNTHYFYTGINNPFIEADVIDASTYTNDTARLPAGDLYASNASRAVSGSARYRTPLTEAVMQQGAFSAEIQRTLSHDDVSTLRYAMSGLDRRQGTADDYRLVINYAGISAADDCNIRVAMDASRTGFAACRVVPRFMGTDLGIARASIFFNPEIDWYFNNEPPCATSVSVPENSWVGFSLPCNMGVSTSASVASVIGSELDIAAYGEHWSVYEYVYSSQPGSRQAGVYRKLALTDELQNGQGYWVINMLKPVNIIVRGEYSAQIDTPVFTEQNDGQLSGWNFIGHPFRYPVVWADTMVIDTDGRALTLSEADPALVDNLTGGPAGISTSCSQSSGPASTCVLASRAFAYNSEQQIYDRLDRYSGTIDAGSAVWIYAGKNNAAVRFSMPAAERHTP